MQIILLKALTAVIFISASITGVYAGNKNRSSGYFSCIADPDNASSCYEYNQTPLIRIGDYVSSRFVDFGGFFEARNEQRFNQSILPNHNWRGYGFLYGHIHGFVDSRDIRQKYSVGIELLH